jgi:hypothetical protein
VDDYRRVGTVCERILRCGVMNGGCPAFSTCTETVDGGVRCTCDAGFVPETGPSGRVAACLEPTTGPTGDGDTVFEASAATDGAPSTSQSAGSSAWIVLAVCLVAVVPLVAMAAYDFHHSRAAPSASAVPLPSSTTVRDVADDGDHGLRVGLLDEFNDDVSP